MQKEYNLEGCLYCHRKLKARPPDFPQINHTEHYEFLHVNDLKTKCIECHSPHEPVFLLTEVSKSRIHPVVYRCTECHDKKPERSPKDVPEHPAIFECQDCHKEIVKDFSSKPHHNYVECRTCHLYHNLENENTGRIYKNGNAKLCLLCHEKKPFKDEKYPPKIEWPSHVGNSKIMEKSSEKIFAFDIDRTWGYLVSISFWIFLASLIYVYWDQIKIGKKRKNNTPGRAI